MTTADTNKKVSKKKLWIVAALFFALVTGLPLAIYSFMGGSDSGGAHLAAHQYRIAQKEPVTNSVAVKGRIAAGQNATIRTSLTTPVDTINVAVGDRVTRGQTLAVISTSELRDQLDSALQQQQSATEQADQQVAAAQTALSNYQQRLNEGLAPEINTAESALRDATEAYNKAQNEFREAKDKAAQGRTPEIISAQQNVEAARQSLLNAALSATRAGVGSAVELTGTRPEQNPDGSPIPEQAINTHLNTVDAAAGVVTATQNLALAQKSYEDALAAVDKQLAESQRAVAAAFNQKKDAAVGLESAKLASREQLKTLRDAVANAQTASNTAATSQSATTDKLTQDINKGTITAPFDGVVTSVNATAGVPASGALVTIADTSSLVVKTQIREMDLTKVAIGQKVEVTTTLTGKKTFHGTVTTVSPVASNLPAESEQPNQGPATEANPTFAVDITIDDPTDELRVGGTARAKIITRSEDTGFKVARDAVFDGPDGTHFVLVVPGGANGGVVEKRAVAPGLSNDFDVAVTGDIHAGDRVINQGENNQNLVGQHVEFENKDDANDDGH